MPSQVEMWEYFVRASGGDVLVFWALVQQGWHFQIAASAARYAGTGS